jgi:hypothetical protein
VLTLMFVLLCIGVLAGLDAARGERSWSEWWRSLR